MIIPRSLLDIGIATKEDPSQQHYSERKLQESKNIIDKLDSGKDSEKSMVDQHESPADHKALWGWISTEATRLSSLRDVDQASETMSMIKKARVSVRAKSYSSMVGKLYNKIK